MSETFYTNWLGLQEMTQLWLLQCLGRREANSKCLNGIRVMKTEYTFT